MPERARLLTIGLITFIVGVILFFPARVAYRWFAPPEIKVSGISGSVWKGSANEASVSGVYLRELQWRFRPLDLATAKLGYAIETKLASGFVQGDVAFGITGNVVASDISASLPVSTLQPVLGVSDVQGSLSAQLSKLVIADNLPVAIDGVVEISGLIVPLIQRDSIGGFKAEFFTEDDGVLASVEDTDAVVDLAGSFEISADRSYRFLGQLSAKPDAPAPVRQQLQFLGSANDRGQHELRLEGTL